MSDIWATIIASVLTTAIIFSMWFAFFYILLKAVTA